MKNTQDFYAGVLFMLVGSAFGWGALDYQVGSSGRMGPGYFPLLLGVLLALLGAAMMLRAALFQADRVNAIGPWAWKPMVAIIAANLLFGVALGGLPGLKLPALGLMAGIYLLTFVACLAGERFKFKEAALLATALAALSYLAFVLLLQLQLPVWPVFLVAN
ncbi:tripartite tricarboxylate transporter TctB family protein [Rhodoferax sp.]|uniref:tripartite tricarboxylate transporter TctB family protein n=1 Tax=Rhodoferax sp. TaxID=50421 RepID=UPI002722ECB8|nr:tripartite tricarboxylate transporter TctB family protein [Rhodoferax sp.]MDO8317914.1 tripartite tricarboxylate transporter TctB family protein [Rhodoferax sp.]